MTERELRQKVADTARKYRGCKESDGSHRKIIDRYNASKPLARGYAVKYTDAWCATFASAVFIECGLTDIAPKECGCNEMIKLYVALGRWMENDAYTPQIGDVIFYDWQDDGVGDNKGSSDHVGIVTSVSGHNFTVTEGNMSKAVGDRAMQVNGKYIRGFGLPDYASKADKATADDQKDTSNTALNTVPQWVGEVDVKEGQYLAVRKWAGAEYAKLASYPQLARGNWIDVCDSRKAADGSTWYYIRIAGRIYGFVQADYIKKAGETSAAKEYRVGDEVSFTGNTHYVSSYATAKGKTASPCTAKVTAINLKGAHPYHVQGDNVCGWVNVEDIE